MLKIFLVEDEFVIRNGVKNSIDWKTEGYEFAGEAGDGELAYPLIKKAKPDILITDIKMPFMDGLELSSAVKKEFPDMKIIILSGYNEFDYAKKAISIGVTDYLLKPVSSAKLLETINGVADMIRKEQEEKALLKQYQEDMKENVEQEKYKLFNQLISGSLTMAEMLEMGERLNMDLSASAYNIILFKVMVADHSTDYSDSLVKAAECIEDLAAGEKSVHSFRRGIEGWAFLIKGDSREDVDAKSGRFCEKLEEELGDYIMLQYFGGIGKVVYRIRELGNSFQAADSAFAGRFICEMNQIVQAGNRRSAEIQESVEIHGLGAMNQNRKLVEKFLQDGRLEELPSFLQVYLEGIQEHNLRSIVLRQYVAMDVYISVMTFGERLNIAKEELTQSCGDVNQIAEHIASVESIKEYMEHLLGNMLVLRDTKSGRRCSDIIVKAQAYISEHYMSEEMSLNHVASYVNISPSYFSSIFSQETGSTFVEYLTAIRMEKAKELLLYTNKKTSEIAFEVGYKDAHYFSYIFKKTQNCSPKEYRTPKKGKKV